MSFSDDEDFDDIYGETPKVEQKQEVQEPSAPEIKEPTPVAEESVSAPVEAVSTAPDLVAPQPITSISVALPNQPAPVSQFGSAADQAVVAALSASLENNNSNDRNYNQQQIQPSSSDSGTPAPSGSIKADLSAEITKMFVGGLNWDTSEDDLKDYFSKYGPVISVQIRKDREGKSKGYGFVDFERASSIAEVLATRHILDGKVIDPKRAIPKTEQDKIGKIFVGGLHPEIKPKAFEEFFSKYGNIIDAQLMINKNTGMCRGFGFITYDTPQAIEPLVAAKFIDFNGKKIEIKRAEQKASLATPARGRPTQFNEQGTPSQLAGMQNPMGMQMDPQQMQQYWAMMQENYRQMAEQQGIDVSQMMQQNQQQMYMMMNMMNNNNGGMNSGNPDSQMMHQAQQPQQFDMGTQGIPVIGDQQQDDYGFNDNNRFNNGGRYNDDNNRFDDDNRFGDEGRFSNNRGGFRGNRGGFRGNRGGFRGGRGGFRGGRGGRGGSREYHPYRN
ncbi:hypothetical protein QEN19_004064 [Hanseniaspora menglaensis]